MPEALKCPNCAAPLEAAQAKGPTVTCEYCGHDVLLPFAPQAEPRWTNAPGGELLFGDMARFAQIGTLARAGRRAEASALYRELSGCGVAEADDAIARALQGHPITIVQTTVSNGGAPRQIFNAGFSPFGEEFASAMEHIHFAETPRIVNAPVVIDAKPILRTVIKIFVAIFGLALAGGLIVFVAGMFVVKKAVEEATPPPPARQVEKAPSAPKKP